MTITYFIRITYGDKAIIVESMIAGQSVIDSAPRGINEDIALSAFVLRHKNLADTMLHTDSTANIEARRAVTQREYATRDIYGSKV